MNMHILWQSVLAGFCFGVWPCFTRTGSIPAAWLSICFSIGSILVAAAFMAVAGREALTTRQLGTGVFAGTVNGIGFLVYAMLIKNQTLDRASDLSSIVPTVTIVVMLVAALIAITTLHEPVTFRKIAGITCAILAVFLLQGNGRGH